MSPCLTRRHHRIPSIFNIYLPSPARSLLLPLRWFFNYLLEHFTIKLIFLLKQLPKNGAEAAERRRRWASAWCEDRCDGRIEGNESGVVWSGNTQEQEKNFLFVLSCLFFFCFYCTPSHVRFIQSEEIPFQSIIFIKNFTLEFSPLAFLCVFFSCSSPVCGTHIECLYYSSNNNNETSWYTRRSWGWSASAQLMWNEQKKNRVCTEAGKFSSFFFVNSNSTIWICVFERERVFAASSLSALARALSWVCCAVLPLLFAIFQCPSARFCIFSRRLLSDTRNSVVYIRYISSSYHYLISSRGRAGERGPWKSRTRTSIYVWMFCIEVVWKSRSAAAALLQYHIGINSFFFRWGALSLSEKYFYMWSVSVCGVRGEARGKKMNFLLFLFFLFEEIDWGILHEWGSQRAAHSTLAAWGWGWNFFWGVAKKRMWRSSDNDDDEGGKRMASTEKRESKWERKMNESTSLGVSNFI